MELYRLTGRGEELSYSYRSPRTPEWGVIHFLNKHGVATKEQIFASVPTANSMTLAKLRLRGLIMGGERAGI